MKLLKIENGKGEYYSFKQRVYYEINNIDRDALLEIINHIMDNNDFEIDEYKTNSINNNVQEIVYKEIYDKLYHLIKDKEKIITEINSKYEAALNKYSE